MNTEQRLKQLFENDHWSEDDKHWVLHYLESTDNQELRNLMEEKFRDDSDSNIQHTAAERLLALIHEKISPAKPKHRLFSLTNRKRLSIAASIIFIAGAA